MGNKDRKDIKYENLQVSSYASANNEDDLKESSMNFVETKSVTSSEDSDGDLFKTNLTAGVAVSKNNPFTNLFIKFGTGISSFFGLIRRLMIVYYFLACLACLQMMILFYYNYNNQNQGWFGKTSFGGFPYSRPICKIIPAGVQTIKIGCEGDDTITEVFDYGFLPRSRYVEKNQ